MEDQFFEWVNWADYGLILQFFHCALKVAIDEFPIGTKFYQITMDYDEGEMIFYQEIDNDVHQVASFKLEFKLNRNPG